ncbi:hypothetical protein LEP1GSC123_2246 [Leptospira borgpetersenii str. 200701203]|uniref:Uncharacterized protein n=1 Tax=Leptospira borgpetersenii str. 200701203 TaxID=1193007 RepID=M3HRL2_LEPBO|nr:hypothetical protein LEP1GSC123_2246 [Leptospira borgpetersenii str. 200701203]
MSALKMENILSLPNAIACPKIQYSTKDHLKKKLSSLRTTF